MVKKKRVSSGDNQDQLAKLAFSSTDTMLVDFHKQYNAILAKKDEDTQHFFLSLRNWSRIKMRSMDPKFLNKKLSDVLCKQDIKEENTKDVNSFVKPMPVAVESRPQKRITRQLSVSQKQSIGLSDTILAGPSRDFAAAVFADTKTPAPFNPSQLKNMSTPFATPKVIDASNISIMNGTCCRSARPNEIVVSLRGSPVRVDPAGLPTQTGPVASSRRKVTRETPSTAVRGRAVSRTKNRRSRSAQPAPGHVATFPLSDGKTILLPLDSDGAQEAPLHLDQADKTKLLALSSQIQKQVQSILAANI